MDRTKDVPEVTQEECAQHLRNCAAVWREAAAEGIFELAETVCHLADELEALPIIEGKYVKPLTFIPRWLEKAVANLRLRQADTDYHKGWEAALHAVLEQFDSRTGKARHRTEATCLLTAEIADLRAENERLQLDGIHTCHDECQRPTCVLRRQLDEAMEVLGKARAALHQHYVDWDGEPEDAVPLQLARSECDRILAKDQQP